MAYFEATAEQKVLANIGRAMMDFSEAYGIENGLKGVTDNGLATLNDLSHVGSMLTRFGTTFGPKAEDFTVEDQKLIADWLQKKVDIERK